jgi:hypothetical protein
MRFRELAEHIKAEMEVPAAPNMFAAPTLAEIVIAGRQRSIGDVTPLPVNLRKLREEARIVSGIHDVYGSLYDEIGFGRVMNKCSKSRLVLKDIVMARLARPCSKRSSAELLERDFGISHPLEKIYRMMDTLDAEKIASFLTLTMRHPKRFSKNFGRTVWI